MRLRSLLLLTAGLALLSLSCDPRSGSPPRKFTSSVQADWRNTLEEDLHLLGHRNWILVVDKAFPEQSSPGMKYLYVERELLPILRQVLESVERSSHVRPVIYRDRELDFVPGDRAPGIDDFRREAGELLGDREVHTLLHDEVFAMLDESSSLFRVLVIKSRTALPYTSVFIQLDCAYWGPEDEAALRDAMRVDTLPAPPESER